LIHISILCDFKTHWFHVLVPISGKQVNDSLRNVLKSNGIVVKAIAQNMTSSLSSRVTKASPGLVVPVHVTNGGGTVCVHSKKQDLGCKNANGESTLQFVFAAGSLAPDEMFTVCIKGNPRPHCVGGTPTPTADVYIESDSRSTPTTPEIVRVQDTITSGDTSWKEFGVFLGPIQKHTGVFHNENGVFIPWTTLCSASQSYLRVM
jgi:hypothetical protein